MPTAPMPMSGCGEKKINDFKDCAAAGYPIMESYPRQCRTADEKTFIEEIGNELEKIDLIRVDFPRPNQIIQNPLIITGEARGLWFFEASFPINLLDENGNLIAQSLGDAQSDWMTNEFVPFKSIMEFSSPETKKGFLIFKKDNPSGLPEHEDQMEIPVVFSEPETIKVNVYFNNSNLDPEFSCHKVFAVEREVVKTPALARAALNELLKGVSEEEKAKGFFTSINQDVIIQKLTIKNDIAEVDFDEQMEYQMGGSCRVSAIRSQIIETLKQFSTVKEVIISVNGRTEDILQP